MIIAQKETERYSNIKDDKEYIHITKEEFEIKDISESELTEFYNNCLIDNDSEENYFSYGISTGWDGELYSIEVERFIEGLESWIESEKENQEEGDGTYYFDLAKKLKDQLIKYEDYDLIFREKVKE